jgi:hypothetical protein
MTDEPVKAPMGLLAVMSKRPGGGEASVAEEPVEEAEDPEPEAQVVAGGEVMSAMRSGDTEAFTRALKSFIRITRLLED